MVTPPNLTSQHPKSAESNLPGVSSEHWNWVRQLLADVNRQDRHENWLAAWGQWQLVTRQFRQAEFRQMRQREPQAEDLRLHEMVLTGLIALGQQVLAGINAAGEADEFRRLGFDPAAAEAQLALLRQNWEEWHGTVNQERLESLQARIADLNGSPSNH